MLAVIYNNPTGRGIGKCQNWKVSESIFAHFERNFKVSELENVRIGKCQNLKVSELESVRIGKKLSNSDTFQF